VHLPYLPEQAARNPGAPSMAIETQLAAVRSIIQTALTQHIDVRENAGQLH
jgi:pyroglutamyl-peptidase